MTILIQFLPAGNKIVNYLYALNPSGERKSDGAAPDPDVENVQYWLKLPKNSQI